MGVLLNGTRVGEPAYGVNPNGTQTYWNALFGGSQVWPPAADQLVDVWLRPVDFQSQPLYADHPELKVAPVAITADGRMTDVDDFVLTSSDTSIATISDSNVVDIVSTPTTMLTALKNDAYQPATIGVNLPDSSGKMTVIYKSPTTAKSVVLYWRVLTDAADSQPHGNATMTSLGNGVFKGAFDYDGKTGFTLAFQRDGSDGAWSNPAKQPATANRFAYVADTTVSYPPTGSKQIIVQPDQPETAPVGSLWCRTEKLHNGLRYYTGAVGDDANVMCFLIDRVREVWRKEWSGWTLLTGKELE